jgi:hypothetical protein
MSDSTIPVATPMMLMLIAIALVIAVVVGSALWGRRTAKRESQSTAGAVAGAVDKAESTALPPIEQPQRRTAMVGPLVAPQQACRPTPFAPERRQAVQPPTSRRPGLTARWKGAHRLVAPGSHRTA